MIVGAGDYTYELVEDWPRLPEWVELGQTSIMVDSQDRVYLFNRSRHPMVVVERDGTFVGTWGEGSLTSAHGGFVDVNDNLYLPVIRSHVVLRYTTAGAETLRLGAWGVASNPDCVGEATQYSSGPLQRAYPPFAMPTDVAVAPDGSIYVTDGYANARVHRFSSDGLLLHSWGEPGHGHGQFWSPHGVWVHDDGRVFVADRENHRLQIFTAHGDFLEEWDDLRSPCDIVIRDGAVFVAEGIGFRPKEQVGAVTIRSLDGTRLAEWTHEPARPGHALWLDSEGSLYLNQTVEGRRVVKYQRIRD